MTQPRLRARCALSLFFFTPLLGVADTALASSGIGFVYADQPAAASYLPVRARAFSSGYARPEITRSATGVYSVRFPGLGGGTTSGGNVQVTAYGTANEHCKVASWSSSGADFTAGVRCFNAQGAARDTRYSVLISWPEPGDLGGAYAWADQQSSASYTPNTTYAFNPGGQPITITRSNTGRYLVRFAGLGAAQVNGGHVQLTAYGTTADRCQLTGWAASGADFTANVSCYTHAGAFVDSRFNILVRAAKEASARHSYVWADQASTASYTPSATYSKNTSGGTMNVTRTAVGVYNVRLNGLADSGRTGEHAHVTPYSASYATCVLSDWTGSPNLTVTVRCFSPNGPADSRFNLLVTTRKKYPNDPLSDGIGRLEHWSDTKPRLRFDGSAVRTTASSIVPLAGSAAIERALSYLQEHRGLYGINDPSQDLFLRRLHQDSTGDNVFFGSRAGGLVVEGAELGVRIEGGRVVSTNGSYVSGMPQLTAPELSPYAAEQLALLELDLQSPQVSAETRAFYIDTRTKGPSNLRPAWRVVVDGNEPKTGLSNIYLYFIDATDGSILRRLGLNRTDKEVEVWTANNNMELRGCGFSGPVNQWFNTAGSLAAYSGDFDGQVSFDASHSIYDAFFARFGRRGPDGRDRMLKSFVHAFIPDDFGNPTDNAYFQPGCGHMAFSDGMATLDVFAHEITHQMSDPYLEYLDDSGALNESYSDIFATMIDYDFLIGEDTIIGALRSMSNPPLFGQPDHIRDRTPRGAPADFGGVHVNSGIQNKVAYLLLNGGTHESILVAPILPDKTWRLFYDTLPTLSRNATFDEARDMTVAMAESFVRGGLYGFNTGNVCSVKEAFASVGIGERCSAGGTDGDGDHRTGSDDNCPTIRNPDQTDTDEDGFGDACDLDDDNDGRCDSGGPFPGGAHGVPVGGCVAGAGPGGADNCRLVANPLQEDIDSDGRGEVCDDDDLDRIVNTEDNCPSVYNFRQENLDGDLFGDACDTDDDADGRADTADNCPYGDGDTVFEPGIDTNMSQADSDLDGFGDLCDTCPTDPDPLGIDTDGDLVFNVCDLDDDNDRVCDVGGPHTDSERGVPAGGCWEGLGGSDNCPTVFNTDQIDIDGNGLGLACDEDENFILSGESDGMLAGFIEILDRYTRFPFGVCLPDGPGCPSWLDLKFDTVIDLELPLGFTARIIDDVGRHQAWAVPSGNGLQALLVPTGDAFYRFPGQQDSMVGTRYQVEIIAPDSFVLGQSIPIEIDVHND